MTDEWINDDCNMAQQGVQLGFIFKYASLYCLFEQMARFVIVHNGARGEGV